MIIILLKNFGVRDIFVFPLDHFFHFPYNVYI